ncbi:MAG: hypothetical protein M0018_07665 [Nitrospiraceae bacterium]|nr:hypothetical protein [Nitrospiraceae bacterium]
MRFERALLRNLNELGRAILERRAMVGMEAAESSHTVDFFRLAYDAMFNDMCSHAIKVFDKNPCSSTFWYLYRCEKKAVEQFAEDHKFQFSLLETLGNKLTHVRNKTHFHIDKKDVFNPEKVWREAAISGRELALGIDSAYAILAHLHQVRFGRPFNLPKYDGSDATEIIHCWEQHRQQYRSC